MKKSIVYLGMAMVTFTNFAIASNETPVVQKIASAPITSTPLCTAISKGDINIVKKFVEYGADVNEKSNDMTPLMMAARYNQVEILEFLISKGADLNRKNDNGFTALKYASLSNAKDAEDFLRSKGAKK